MNVHLTNELEYILGLLDGHKLAEHSNPNKIGGQKRTHNSHAQQLDISWLPVFGEHQILLDYQVAISNSCNIDFNSNYLALVVLAIVVQTTEKNKTKLM